MCVDVHVYTLHVCTCAYVHICTHIHLCYMYGGTSVGMGLDRYCRVAPWFITPKDIAFWAPESRREPQAMPCFDRRHARTHPPVLARALAAQDRRRQHQRRQGQV